MTALLLALVLQAAPQSAAPAAARSATVTQAGPDREAPPPPARPDLVKGEGRPTVTIPRIEAKVNVDGRLDEPAWSQAARLGGFWQQQPVDGRPAEEQTEVLVWYSPEAIHFGIVASDSHPEAIRATVADRDNLDRDDTVTVFLDTFWDRRRAFFFTVNPLGAQQDGVQTEGAGSAGHVMGFNQGDRNPDYQFDSKGTITATGYVVEVRIPFKSLRYPGNGHRPGASTCSGRPSAPATRTPGPTCGGPAPASSASPARSTGLHDMKRGLVTEVQPFLAASVNGQRRNDGQFTREETDYTPGVNAAVGFTNTSIDATVNPDFSQVESDAGQVTVERAVRALLPREAPLLPRGHELFATPNQLVYTRRSSSRSRGGKVTGKAGQTRRLPAARDRADDGDATFNIARVRQDIGDNSFAGVTFTDRTTGAGFNRVIAADTRLTFKRCTTCRRRPAARGPRRAACTRSAPVWNVVLDRTGRAWGCRYELLGVGTDFITRSGFVPRNDFVQLRASNRLSWYGARGAAVEDFSVNYHGNRYWDYAGFGAAGPSRARTTCVSRPSSGAAGSCRAGSSTDSWSSTRRCMPGSRWSGPTAASNPSCRPTAPRGSHRRCRSRRPSTSG